MNWGGGKGHLLNTEGDTKHQQRHLGLGFVSVLVSCLILLGFEYFF